MYIISDYISVNGGVNNLTIIKLVRGYCLIKSYTGKTAKKRMETYKRKLEKIGMN